MGMGTESATGAAASATGVPIGTAGGLHARLRAAQVSSRVVSRSAAPPAPSVLTCTLLICATMSWIVVSFSGDTR